MARKSLAPTPAGIPRGLVALLATLMLALTPVATASPVHANTPHPGSLEETEIPRDVGPGHQPMHHGPRWCGAYWNMYYVCLFNDAVVIWFEDVAGVLPGGMDWDMGPARTRSPPAPEEQQEEQERGRDPGVYVNPDRIGIPGVGGNHGCEAFSPAHRDGLTCSFWDRHLMMHNVA